MKNYLLLSLLLALFSLTTISSLSITSNILLQMNRKTKVSNGIKEEKEAFKKWINIFQKPYTIESETGKLKFHIFQKVNRLVNEHNKLYEAKEVTYRISLNFFSDYSDYELADFFSHNQSFKEKKASKHKKSSNINSISNMIKSFVKNKAEEDQQKKEEEEKYSNTYFDSHLPIEPEAVLVGSSFIEKERIKLENKENNKDFISEDSKKRDQFNCGNCYAYATVTVLEAMIKKQYKQDIKLSVDFLTDCNYYTNYRTKNGCDGADILDLFSLIKNFGIISQEDYNVYKDIPKDKQHERKVCNYELVKKAKKVYKSFGNSFCSVVTKITDKKLTANSENECINQSINYLKNGPYIANLFIPKESNYNPFDATGNNLRNFNSYVSSDGNDVFKFKCDNPFELYEFDNPNKFQHAITVIDIVEEQNNLGYAIVKNSYGYKWGHQSFGRIEISFKSFGDFGLISQIRQPILLGSIEREVFEGFEIENMAYLSFIKKYEDKVTQSSVNKLIYKIAEDKIKKPFIEYSNEYSYKVISNNIDQYYGEFTEDEINIYNLIKGIKQPSNQNISNGNNNQFTTIKNEPSRTNNLINVKKVEPTQKKELTNGKRSGSKGVSLVSSKSKRGISVVSSKSKGKNNTEEDNKNYSNKSSYTSYSNYATKEE